MQHYEHLEPEQLDAFRQAGDVLKDHFPNYVIIAASTVDDGGEVILRSFNGSHSAALGMITQYKHELIKNSA